MSDLDPALWATVPREPTKRMLDEAYRKMRMDPSCAPFSKRILLKAWDAMLAISPAPDVPAAPATGEPTP